MSTSVRKTNPRQTSRAARSELWQATCERLEVPAVIAVQVLAGVLDEAAIAAHPLRHHWRNEYQAEVTWHQAGTKAARQLKHRRARQIAAALGVSQHSAFQILKGTQEPAAALAAAQARQHEQRQAARREQWLAAAIAALQNQGLPQNMAEQVVQPVARTPDLDADPAATAGQLWLERQQQSGLASPAELVAAWEQHRAWTVEQLRRQQERQVRAAHAGMRPEHITQLCSADQIADTLHTLLHLNHWAKARDRLLYVDRQGLYQVKARLLQEAHRQGQVQLVGYLAGPTEFTPLDDAGLDPVLEHLQDIVADASAGHREPDDPDYVTARQLYESATGQAIDADLPELAAVACFVRRRLAELQRQAITTRRPIPTAELQALLVSPDDVPSIAYTAAGDYRWHRWTPGWDELDDRDLAPLDPEWFSLVAVRYEAAAGRYTFHLPFRAAERFVAAEALRQLQEQGEQREAGEFFGCEITEEESLAHPIGELLARLGVDVGIVCPQHLVDKAEHVAQIEAQRAARWAEWESEDGPFDDDDDEF
ncbi:MAG: hypothetical protein KKB13_08260 [Chloroflexi bacterium]|nr:hypothetical protein [Chloroflexota bacterium]